MNIPQAGFYPFWFWNGVQNEAGIIHQLDEIADSGCKGFALHSRQGNQIPYLSPRWLDLVEFTCEESRKRNLKIWLYDEDGFPSGNAGMRVQKSRPDLVQKSLHFSVVPSDPYASSFASFSADGKTPVSEADLPQGTPVLRFELHLNPEHVDTLSPDTVKYFLDLNHELYAKRIGKFFGNTVEAVYTDDESFLVWYENSFVWSEALENELGSSYRCHLGKLVFDQPGSDGFRKKYYRAAQKLFIEHFIRPQQKWCHDHNLVYLGHLCGDEGPRSRTIKNYCSPEPYYLAEDIPSVDDFLLDMKDLGYLKRPYTGDAYRINPCGLEKCYHLYTYLAASSVANRSGVNQVSSETWAFLGWNMPVEFLEPQTIFEIAMGQTLLTPHAFYYTLDGEAEQDCPPSYFIQQPYWSMLKKRLPVWNRLAEHTASMHRAPETVVIVPDALISMQNGDALNGNPGKLAEADLALQNMILQMMRRHIDFDLIEEPQIQNSVRDGMVLRSGKMSYRNIVYSSSIPLTEQTFAKIDGMDIFCENDINNIPALGEFPEELLVVKRTKSNGVSSWILQNLSGKPMKLDSAFPKTQLFIVDPVSETAVFRGDAFPENFTLPHGKALLLEKDWNGKTVAFNQSIFAPRGEEIALRLQDELGDLVKKGFAGKTGVFIYRAEFEGTARILELTMTGGVAEVEINGKSAGICWGSDLLAISEFTVKGINKLMIRFANTAGNIYGELDAPFGVENARLFK
ncbi:MAG: hypothetical protein J6S24_03110 [Lentisphaeria bacterium]|nr:hypothetical protein [Lentisphaeria bacterium]